MATPREGSVARERATPCVAASVALPRGRGSGSCMTRHAGIAVYSSCSARLTARWVAIYEKAATDENKTNRSRVMQEAQEIACFSEAVFCCIGWCISQQLQARECTQMYANVREVLRHAIVRECTREKGHALVVRKCTRHITKMWGSARKPHLPMYANVRECTRVF